MQPHTEHISVIPVVYMRRTGAYGAENYKLMQEMKAWVQRQNLWDGDGTIYGIAQDNAMITPPEQCRYDVCFVTELTFQDTAIQYGVIPPGTYIVFQIPHTFEDVGRFWVSIEDNIKKEEKQIDASRPILERYQFSLVENGYCEFCVPILSHID